MKLWPLDPKTGARSSSLKTGHKPPSIAELASRTSASFDIEILVGRDGLAAVAKAEEAAQAEETAAKTNEAAARAAEAAEVAELESAEGAPAAVASPEEGGENSYTTKKCDEEGGVQDSTVTAVETVPSTVGAQGEVCSATTTASGATATTTGSAAPRGASEGTTTTDEKATAVEAAATPLLRKLALEVEVFAIGSINVPYLMALIKVSFEQVRARWCFPFP